MASDLGAAAGVVPPDGKMAAMAPFATDELEPSLERTRIRSIVTAVDVAALAGKNVVVGGWVRTGREQGKGSFAFLELNDGSCLANLQVIVDAAVHPLAQLTPTGTCVVIEGVLKRPPEGVKQSLELRAERILEVGPCDPGKYPLPKTRLTLEFLRDWVHLRARTNTVRLCSLIIFVFITIIGNLGSFLSSCCFHSGVALVE